MFTVLECDIIAFNLIIPKEYLLIVKELFHGIQDKIELATERYTFYAFIKFPQTFVILQI